VGPTTKLNLKKYAKMNVRNTAPMSKAKTIHRGRECFLKKALDLWLSKLKKSKYNAFIQLRFAQA